MQVARALAGRRGLAALTLAAGALLALRPAPRRSPALAPITPEAPHDELTMAPRVIDADADGHGELLGSDGAMLLGAQPARGVLSHAALPTGHGSPGLSLWPPAPVWPSLQGGRLSIEHGLLLPTTRYRLDIAWPDGQQQRVWFETLPLAEVIARGPEAGRIDPLAPVWLRLGADADRASVEASLKIEPAEHGRVEWADDRTLRFLPSKPMAYGVLHRVSVAGATASGEPVKPSVWSFRTLIPPPARITPGDDAPAVFTFDDGTHDMQQAWRLLDLLRKHEVKAIFFPTGRWARAHHDYIARALADGHLLCNHSETHARLPRLTDAQIEHEIKNGAGQGACDLLRPPSMDTSKRVERVASSLGYRMFLWDVDSRDWEGMPSEDIVHRVLARVKPGAVMLFHMHAPGTLEALPRLFEALRKAGYRLTHEGMKDSPRPPEDGPVEVAPGLEGI